MNEGLSKTDNWNIVSVRQVCSVGKIQFLLQDIYGIENKKQLNKEKLGYEKDVNNPNSAGEDEDTNCVVCLSEPRDTIMLPCRHLCLCSSCADKLRYQHGNCPFCRMPFQALLRLKAIKNGRNRREYSLADALNNISKPHSKTRRERAKQKKEEYEKAKREGKALPGTKSRVKRPPDEELIGTGFGAAPVKTTSTICFENHSFC